MNPADGPPGPLPGDTDSPASVLRALYEALSGPAGRPRDWDRFRALLHPEARMIRVVDEPDPEAPGETRPVPRIMGVDDYVENVRELLATEPFWENEIHRTEERFRHVGHVFSTYESRREPDGEPFARGINSAQLLHDGERWWVLSVAWSVETEDEPIPERYLET